MDRLVKYASSYKVIAGLLLPLVLCFVAGHYIMGLSFYVVAGLTVVRFYCAALLAVLAIRAAALLSARLFGEALLTFGLIALLLQGVYAYGFRFSARTGIGLGEGPDKYYESEQGPWTRPFSLPIVLTESRPDRPDTCTVLLDEKTQTMSKGKTLPWQGLDLTVTSIEEAPLFVLSDSKGEELEAGFIKLNFDESGEALFQFAGVPHRIYVSLPGNGKEVWKKEGKAWKKKTVPPDKEKQKTAGEILHLLVMRGKVTAFDADVKRGDTISFEGLNLRFEKGAPWIELKVEKALNYYLLYAGVGLMITGLAAAVLRRKK